MPVRSRSSSVIGKDTLGRTDMDITLEEDSRAVLQLRVDMMYEEQCEHQQELNQMKATQEDTVKTAKILLESLDKAIQAMQTQQRQLASVDVELLQRIGETRKRTIQSTQQLHHHQTQEVAEELLRTQQIAQDEWANINKTQTQPVTGITAIWDVGKADNSTHSGNERPNRSKPNKQSAPELSTYDINNDWRSGKTMHGITSIGKMR